MTATVILAGPSQRAYALSLLNDAPLGTVVQFKERTRSLDQNAKMHAMLTDISRAAPGGRRATVDQWKHIMMSACKFECQFETGLDGRPFAVGFSSSKLTVAQMAELITFIDYWGTTNGVRWSEPAPSEIAA